MMGRRDQPSRRQEHAGGREASATNTARGANSIDLFQKGIFGQYGVDLARSSSFTLF